MSLLSLLKISCSCLIKTEVVLKFPMLVANSLKSLRLIKTEVVLKCIFTTSN